MLNALGTADKYKGGYETRVFRRLREFTGPSEGTKPLEDLFRLFLVNCALRNGDAHLKNFGITYQLVTGSAHLAPVYDIVTTWSYIPNDPMALTSMARPNGLIAKTRSGSRRPAPICRRKK